MPIQRKLRDSILFFAFLILVTQPAPAAKFALGSSFDLPSLLAARDPEKLLSDLKPDIRRKVDDRVSAQVTEDSDLAVKRNKNGLYPNPSLQAYINRLALSLIPKEASSNVFVNFKIVEDPIPYADALSTGTIYISSGLISLLDNESQLAFLLMHEAGHVLLSHSLYQIIQVENPSFGDSMKDSLIGGLIGGLAGGLMERRGGRKATSENISAYSELGSEVAAAIRSQRFVNDIELEADQFATQILLDNSFDAREIPPLMAKVGDVVRRSGAVVDLAFGNARNLPVRSQKILEYLAGLYQPLVGQILTGSGFRMSSPRYNQLMSELKRDNGLLAFERDFFAIAKSNLEEAASVRTDDPLTMYGLGMLYRTIGRTPQDRAKASSYLKSAIEFDEIRHRFPETYLEYAVELLSREDPQYYPEIQNALKAYVVLFQRKMGGKLPPEMRFVYDYLDLTGDRSWIAYSVDNVSSEVPYQLTGDKKIDGNSLAQKPEAPLKK